MSLRNKPYLIIGLNPQDYEIFDKRIMKPITYQLSFEEEKIEGSMVSQIIDDVQIGKKKIEYCMPNNVGVLLSISKKSNEQAKKYFKEHFEEIDQANIDKEDKIKFLKRKSIEVCDYIELIQSSIVFSYTSLEAFSNLSIPENYFYVQKIKSKGIDERYDKEAIEKWINLTTKLNVILPEIYKTKKLQETNLWSYFTKLEKLRHEIIHQKSIDRTEFYKVYFNRDIFKVSNIGEEIIKYFYKNQKLSISNPLWPWVIGDKKEFPIFKADPERFEVIGNIHEGIKKK